MVEKVNPSNTRPAESFKTAGSISYARGGGGYIVPANEQTEIATQDGDIDETTFTAFDASFSSSSTDFTVQPGEAFVFGSWLGIDTNTTISLSTGLADEPIYIGWDRTSSDDVIIGPDDGRFATASGDTDQKIRLYEVSTDGTGVTSVTDRRLIGYFEIADDALIGGDTLESGHRIELAADEQMVVGGSYTLNGDAQIDGDLVTVSNITSHDDLVDVDPTDHLEVVKSVQITLTSGSTPAFDGTLTNMFGEETTAFDLTVAPTNGLNDTYAFNFDDGKRWQNGSWDVPITINWDIDPGTDLDVTVRAHRRT
jgi:hypothetical protein